ncbi:hypothetical protein WK68_13000 [Burkholderia ubonensis]|nr:hypothetical protein WK68_13000 [Burkholderia ubonensis]
MPEREASEKERARRAAIPGFRTSMIEKRPRLIAAGRRRAKEWRYGRSTCLIGISAPIGPYAKQCLFFPALMGGIFF